MPFAMIKLYLVLSVILVIVTGGGWLYVQNLKSERNEALEEVGSLRLELQSEKISRARALDQAKRIREAYDSNRLELDRLHSKLQDTQADRDEALRKLREAHIRERLENDPVDLARRATRGTLRIFDDLSEASGGSRRFFPDGQRMFMDAGEGSSNSNGDGTSNGAVSDTTAEADADSPSGN